MHKSLRSTMVRLLACEKTLENFQYLGAHFLCQTPLLDGLRLLQPYSGADPSLDILEIHLPKQKPHLTQQPISSYLYCLKYLKSDHPAYQWGVNTIFALGILSSIGPSASSDHQTTITTLVSRFRLASQALIKSQ